MISEELGNIISTAKFLLAERHNLSASEAALTAVDLTIAINMDLSNGVSKKELSEANEIYKKLYKIAIDDLKK